MGQCSQSSLIWEFSKKHETIYIDYEAPKEPNHLRPNWRHKWWDNHALFKFSCFKDIKLDTISSSEKLYTVWHSLHTLKHNGWCTAHLLSNTFPRGVMMLQTALKYRKKLKMKNVSNLWRQYAREIQLQYFITPNEHTKWMWWSKCALPPVVLRQTTH